MSTKMYLKNIKGKELKSKFQSHRLNMKTIEPAIQKMFLHIGIVSNFRRFIRLCF